MDLSDPNLADLLINIADQGTKLSVDQAPIGMARWCGHTLLISGVYY